jgi:hypothetical protein
MVVAAVQTRGSVVVVGDRRGGGHRSYRGSNQRRRG